MTHRSRFNGINLLGCYFRILQIQQSGLDIYWRRRNNPLPTVADTCKVMKASQGETKLSLQSLLSAFLILAMGIGLATGAFLAELLLHFICLRQEV